MHFSLTSRRYSLTARTQHAFRRADIMIAADWHFPVPRFCRYEAASVVVAPQPQRRRWAVFASRIAALAQTQRRVIANTASIAIAANRSRLGRIPSAVMLIRLTPEGSHE
jgi:hypothetical protein